MVLIKSEAINTLGFSSIWVNLYIWNTFQNINIQLDKELHFLIPG